MANKLLIIHGYSDGSTSFTGLRDFFVGAGAYRREDVRFVNYASMDDDAGFWDFADKLEHDYRQLFGDARVDLACHSTGALVARHWLQMRFERAREAGSRKPVSPVERLLMFAPANFGSDLAELGQSALGKFRTTFFNRHQARHNRWESGKQVLQGLEPASPTQWDLSARDLHGEGFFDPALGERACLPVVFAAGRAYGGLQARVMPKRRKAGTDGTVRICGTSLNTRKLTIDFAKAAVQPQWSPERKFSHIPFGIFGEFNHGTIVSGKGDFADPRKGVGPWALRALKIRTLEDYAGYARDLDAYTRRHYEKPPYQQFFFRVRDDVEAAVPDFYLDFFVLGADGQVRRDLTLEFDKRFKADFYTHTADRSCRALLLNLSELKEYLGRLSKARSRLVVDITAPPPVPEIEYTPGYAVLFDPSVEEPLSFLYPNTTTLVEIRLNRVASDEVLHLLDADLARIPVPREPAPTSATGRATLLPSPRRREPG